MCVEARGELPGAGSLLLACGVWAPAIKFNSPTLGVKLYLLSRPEDPACLIPLDPVFVEDCFLFFRQHSALAYQPERFSLVVIFIMRSPRSLDNLCWSLKLKVFQAGYELDVFPRQDSKSVSCLSFSAVGITCEKDLLGSSHRRHVL